MAGITTSPQLRESPETAKDQDASFDCRGHGVDSEAGVCGGACLADAQTDMNASNATRRSAPRVMKPLHNFRIHSLSMNSLEEGCGTLSREHAREAIAEKCRFHLEE
jgi:hypothetical protein